MNYEITNNQSIKDCLLKMQAGDTLILDDGVYQGKFEIWNSGIKIKAKNPRKAILSNKDYYHKIMPNHNECNTFNTFTLYIGGDDVILEDLTIKNEATPSNVYGQAVALHVDGNNFRCQNCSILSAQDTLFTGPMPKDLIERYQGFYPEERLKGLPSVQCYENCIIAGDVDFIFGSATALFKNCDILSIERDGNTPTYVCAPSHPKELPYGYLFYQCNFKGTKGLAYLGRPWRDYGCAAFILCNLGKHIHPLGFNKWNNTNRDKTARFYEYTLNTDLSLREKWAVQLSEEEAFKYVDDFLAFMKENSSKK